MGELTVVVLPHENTPLFESLIVVSERTWRGPMDTLLFGVNVSILTHLLVRVVISCPRISPACFIYMIEDLTYIRGRAVIPPIARTA